MSQGADEGATQQVLALLNHPVFQNTRGVAVDDLEVGDGDVVPIDAGFLADVFPFVSND